MLSVDRPREMPSDKWQRISKVHNNVSSPVGGEDFSTVLDASQLYCGCQD